MFWSYIHSNAFSRDGASLKTCVSRFHSLGLSRYRGSDRRAESLGHKYAAKQLASSYFSTNFDDCPEYSVEIQGPQATVANTGSRDGMELEC